MVSMNKVIIAGNLVRDPELKKTPNGKSVVNFTLAVNDYNSYQAIFVNVTAWEKVAENVNKFLSKGSSALVEGSLYMNSYTNKNGEKRNNLYVNAHNVQFINTSNKKNEEPDNEDVPF